jgi:hypothetical protein
MAKLKTFPTELEHKLTEINEWMFYGDKGKVAKRSRKTLEYVGKVLSKKAFNRHIIECAIEVMEENKARFQITPRMKIAS